MLVAGMVSLTVDGFVDVFRMRKALHSGKGPMPRQTEANMAAQSGEGKSILGTFSNASWRMYCHSRELGSPLLKI